MSYTQFSAQASCEGVEGFNLDSFLNGLMERCVKYILESEWDLIISQIESGDFAAESREDFMKTIKGYTYYHALMCSCSGDVEAVNRQLDEDFEEVKEKLGIKEYKKYWVRIEVSLLSDRAVHKEIIDVLNNSLEDGQAILDWSYNPVTE